MERLPSPFEEAAGTRRIMLNCCSIPTFCNDFDKIIMFQRVKYTLIPTMYLFLLTSPNEYSKYKTIKYQFERAGRASIPRFWSVFVICIHGEEYRAYQANGSFPGQWTTIFTGHTVIQYYANTIIHGPVYTPYGNPCKLRPMCAHRNGFHV